MVDPMIMEVTSHREVLVADGAVASCLSAIRMYPTLTRKRYQNFLPQVFGKMLVIWKMLSQKWLDFVFPG